MLAMTRGPSMKPVCAATNRSAPSATSVVTKNVRPSGMGPMCQPSETFLRQHRAFMVMPWSCRWTSQEEVAKQDAAGGERASEMAM